MNAFALTTCASSPADPAQPAVIDASDVASRAALHAAISQMLGASQVLMSDDAFTRTSVLTLDPARIRDPEGHLAYGRETRKSEQFQLLLTASGGCELVHRRTAAHVLLSDVRCKPQ